MSFTIKINAHGLACPRIVCDRCGKTIDDPETANACWMEEEDRSRVTIEPEFVCKDCDRKTYPKFNSWMQLDHYLVYLFDNSGDDGKEIRGGETRG
jgi:hypothetical protein